MLLMRRRVLNARIASMKVKTMTEGNDSLNALIITWARADKTVRGLPEECYLTTDGITDLCAALRDKNDAELKLHEAAIAAMGDAYNPQSNEQNSPSTVVSSEIPDAGEANYKCGYYDGVKAERERLNKPVSVCHCLACRGEKEHTFNNQYEYACHRKYVEEKKKNTKQPVLVNLEKCCAAIDKVCEEANHYELCPDNMEVEKIAKAVLDAAGVKYHD